MSDLSKMYFFIPRRRERLIAHRASIFMKNYTKRTLKFPKPLPTLPKGEGVSPNTVELRNSVRAELVEAPVNSPSTSSGRTVETLNSTVLGVSPLLRGGVKERGNFTMRLVYITSIVRHPSFISLHFSVK